MDQLPSGALPKPPKLVTEPPKLVTLVEPQPGDSVAFKWLADGAENLAQASIQLDLMSAYLRRLHSLGWSLETPVTAGIAYLISPDRLTACWECGSPVKADTPEDCPECGA